MRKVLIPYQQDLVINYELKNYKNEPIIINQRFVNYVNTNKDLLGIVIHYDDKYIEYIKTTNDDVAILIPDGEDIGMYQDRDQFEYKLINTCLEFNKPLLGICKGIQEINVVLGGSLKNCENHWQTNCEHASSHTVKLDEGKFLDKIVKRNIYVNSFHNQCLDNIADYVVVEGVSEEDCIPECISVKDIKVIGVQWNPSYCPDYYLSKLIIDMFSEL